MKRWLKRGLLGLGLLLGALLVVGVIYEQLSQRAFAATRPPESEFIELDGRRIHYVKRGEGGPTVVFEGGLGSDARMWQEIQPELAKQTTTFSYERAGILWSDPVEGVRTLDAVTDELWALLEATGCPKPYVVVGHSLGGITLRQFVASHREDIAGVVFVDTTPPDLVSAAPEELRRYFKTPPRALVAAAVHTGALRAAWSVSPFVSSLPLDHWFNQHVRDSFSRTYRALLNEAEDDDAWFEQAARIESFGDVPMVVIAATYPDGVDYLAHDPELMARFLSYHRGSMEAQLGLSTNSHLVLAERSDHHVPLHEPQLIIDAVRSVLNADAAPAPLEE